MQTVRVLVADDNDILRAGICTLLSNEADIEVVGEARDGEEAYNVAADLRPNVIVMDLQMPIGDGASASRRIIADLPRVAIVMVSASNPQDALQITTAIGAAAFVSKPECAARLVATIRKVFAEGRFPLMQQASGTYVPPLSKVLPDA